MLTLHAIQSCINESLHLKQSFSKDDGTTTVNKQEAEDATVKDDKVNTFLSSKYEILITEAVMETMDTTSSIEVYWYFDDTKKSCNRIFLLHYDCTQLQQAPQQKNV